MERRKLLAFELDNLLAGVDAALVSGELEVAAGCALAGAELFEMHGPFSDGIALLERVSGRSLFRGTQGRLFRKTGWLLHMAGRHTEALEHYEQALAIAREVGDRRGEGITLGNLAPLHRAQGRLPEATEHYKRALAIAREVGDRRSEGVTLGNLFWLGYEQGRIPEEREQALAIACEVGDRRNEGIILGNLGWLHREQGRIPEALEHYKQALAVAREVGNRRSEGAALGNLGDLLLSQGDLLSAGSRLREAIAISDQAFLVGAGAFRGSLALIRARQGAFDEARSLLVQGEAQLRSVHKPELGKLLCKKARVEHLAGDLDAAAAALNAAEALAVELSLSADSELGQALAVARAEAGR